MTIESEVLRWFNATKCFFGLIGRRFWCYPERVIDGRENHRIDFKEALRITRIIYVDCYD